MGFVLYGLLIAHFTAYHTQYANIGVMFATTVVMKTLAKVAGAKEQSDLIAMGGGALTIGQFADLLKQMNKGGFSGSVTGGTSNGLVGSIFEALKNATVGK